MHFPEVNIFKTAREKKGLTQEQAAEIVDKSVSSIRKWESYSIKGMDMDNVAEMAYQYNSSILMWQFLKLFSPFKDDIPDIEFKDGIQGAAMYLHDAKNEYDEWHSQLMKFLKDGHIDETEREEWSKNIRPTGWEYAARLISTIVLVDEKMGVQQWSK
jgi:transcriptional regulator with XRE-family HTH domain